MPFTLTMPKLSPTMVEGTLVKWHKKPGDHVEAGDLLLEVSTDKATVEYNALDGGWIKKILKAEGQKAEVNEPLAIFIENENESIDGYIPEGTAPTTTKPESAPKETPKQEPKKTATAQTQKEPLVTKAVATPKPQAPKTHTSEPHTSEHRIAASPLAKALATQHGIDLDHIAGSGPRGRIVSRDLFEKEEPCLKTEPQAPTEIIQAHKNPAKESESKTKSEPAPQQKGVVEHRPLSMMRKVIAERLQYSKSTIPHFYLRQEIVVDTLVNLREETKKLGLSLTVNDFIIKAVAIALRKHPHINCGYNPDLHATIHYANIDIAIAVTIPGGLITPILRNADSKPLQKLSQEVKILAQKAKEGKLQPHEFQGGSFTISNLGMFGITDFQAIINPPQGAILAIGAAQEKPVVKNGQVVPGKVLSITLSCDHRVIDGAEAAQFLASLKQLLENPILFLSE